MFLALFCLRSWLFLSSVFLLASNGGVVCFLCVLVFVLVRNLAALLLCLPHLLFCAVLRVGPVFLLPPSGDFCFDSLFFLPVAVGLLLRLRFLPVCYSTGQGSFLVPASCCCDV